MVFKTIKKDLTGNNLQLTIFGTKLRDMQMGIKSIFANPSNWFKEFKDNFKANLSTWFKGFKNSTSFNIDTSKFKDTDWNKLKEFESKLKQGNINVDDFFNGYSDNVKKAGEVMQKTGSSVDKLKTSINGATFASKAAAVGMNLLSMAGNMLIGIGISFAISAITNAINEQAEASRKAAEEAEKVNQTINDISNYKTKIAEIQSALDDNNLSQADAYDKRKELMSIQDELIEKYGDEAGAINNITKAIQGEVNALDGVSDAYAENWLRKNSSIGENAEKYMNETFFHRGTLTPSGGISYETAADSKIAEEYENVLKAAGLDDSQITFSNPVYKDFLGFTHEKTNKIVIGFRMEDATRDEIIAMYDKLTEIINSRAAENPDFDYTNMLELVQEKRNKIADDNYETQKETYEEYGEYLSRTEITYKDTYGKILKIQQDYNAAMLMDDGEAKDKALNNVFELLTETQNSVNGFGEGAAKDYMQGLIDSFNQQSGTTQLKLDYEVNTDNVNSDINNAIKDLKGSDGKPITYEGILDLKQKSKLGILNDTEAETYQKLSDITSKYGINLEQLADTMVELGLITKTTNASVSNSFNLNDYDDKIANITSRMNEYQEIIDKIDNHSITNSELLDLAKEYPSLAPYINDLDSLRSKLVDLKSSSPDALIEELESIDQSELTDKECQSIANLIEVLKRLDGTSVTVETNVTTDDLLTEIGNLKSAYTSVATVIKEYNETGVMSIENWQNLINLSPQYKNILLNEQGQLQLNTQAYLKLAKAQLEQLKITKMQDSIEHFNQLQSEAEALDYLQEVQGKYNEEEENFVQKQWQEAVNAAAIKDAALGRTTYTDALKASFSIWQQDCKLIDAASASLEKNIGVTLGSAEATNTQTSALEEQKQALEDEVSALEDVKKAYEDDKAQREDDMQSIEDLIETTVEMVKKGYENQKEALENAKESRSEYISQIRDELKAEQELNDYRKNLSEKTQAVTDIEQQLAALSGNNSASAEKRRLELQKELQEAQDELDEFKSDHEYEVRDEALAKEEEISNQFYDNQIAKIDEYLDNERQLRYEAMALIEGRTDQFYTDLQNYMYRYTTMTNAEFQHMWDSAYTAMDRYAAGNYSLIGLMEYLQGDIYTLEYQISNTQLAIDGVNSSIDVVSQRISDMSSSLYTYADSINTLNAAVANSENVSLPEANIIPTPNNGYWSLWWRGFDGAYTSYATTKKAAAFEIWQKLKINGEDTTLPEVMDKLELRYYAKGTSSAEPGLAIINENGQEAIMNTSRNGDYHWFSGGETVFTAEQTQNLSRIALIPNIYQKLFGEDGAGLKQASQTLLANNREDIHRSAQSLLNSVASNNQIINQTNKTNINVQGVLDQKTIDNLYNKFEKQMFEKFRQIGNM